ncbi:MAG: cell division topological specificity factor MinE [Alphaproteobacteria bacterium]|nr:cell division topological specificity factor MinE [Alphaproteobacteria bacterium]
MSFLSFLFPKRDNSASIAKERLKIVLSHERAGSHAPDFLPGLQKELIEVVGRYVEIRDDAIRVNLGKSGETSLLEINIEIDGAKLRSMPGKPEIRGPNGKTATAAKAAPPGRAVRPGKSG